MLLSLHPLSCAIFRGDSFLNKEPRLGCLVAWKQRRLIDGNRIFMPEDHLGKATVYHPGANPRVRIPKVYTRVGIFFELSFLPCRRSILYTWTLNVSATCQRNHLTHSKHEILIYAWVDLSSCYFSTKQGTFYPDRTVQWQVVGVHVKRSLIGIRFWSGTSLTISSRPA